MRWTGPVLFATFIYSVATILLRTTTDAMSSLLPAFIMMIMMGAISACIIFLWPKQRSQLRQMIKTKRNLYIVMLCGILYCIGNILYFTYGVQRASNPGYARALTSVEIVLITAFTAVFLGYPLGWAEVFGVFLIITGTVMIVLTQQ